MFQLPTRVRASRLLQCGTLAAAFALSACGPGATDGAADEILSGPLLVRPVGGTWAEQGPGPLALVMGTLIEAGQSPAAIACASGDARVRLTLGPGTRLSRRTSNAFNLQTGSLRVESIGVVPRVFVFFHANTNYIDAEGLKATGDGESLSFTVDTLGEQIEVLQITGQSQVNTIGKDEWELNYVTLKPGEQGMVEPGVRPTKHDLSDTKKGPLLRPSVALEAAAPAAAGAPTSIKVTISAGQSDLFRGFAFEGNDADAFVLIAESAAGSREIVLGADDLKPLATDATLAELTAAKDQPMVLRADLGADRLAAGDWKLSLRYTSYKVHSDGKLWLGEVTSEPILVVVP